MEALTKKCFFFFCKEKDNKVGFRVLSMYRYDFDIDFEECGNIKQIEDNKYQRRYSFDQ